MEKERILPPSTTDIVSELIEIRNSWIVKLLREDELAIFLEEQYDTLALSAVKIEFLKRDLKELQRAPLDLVHYSALIREVREKGVSAKESHLFLKELDLIFKKYIAN